MIDPYFYFIITKNCNYRCRHCFLDAGPGKKDSTINEEDFRKVIRHLPKVSSSLTLTGGEVFTIQETLFRYLDYIDFENQRRQRQRQGRIKTCVQTNGFWANGNKKTKVILEELSKLGVDKLDIPSDDIYHKEQGLDPQIILDLESLAEESGLFSKVTLRGSHFGETIMPVGRGKAINPDLFYLEGNYKAGCRSSLDKYKVSILPDGSIFSCCFLQARLPGNVIKEPLVNIIRRARKNPRLKTLNEGCIRNIALMDGWLERDVEDLISGNGECGTCARLYEKGIC